MVCVAHGFACFRRLVFQSCLTLGPNSRFAPGAKYADLPMRKICSIILLHSFHGCPPLFNPTYLQNDSYPSATAELLKTQCPSTVSTAPAVFHAEKHQLTQALFLARSLEYTTRASFPEQIAENLLTNPRTKAVKTNTLGWGADSECQTQVKLNKRQ